MAYYYKSSHNKLLLFNDNTLIRSTPNLHITDLWLRHYRTKKDRFHFLAWLTASLTILALIVHLKSKLSSVLNKQNQQLINTDSFDRLETFFELRDDTEWRLAETRNNFDQRTIIDGQLHSRNRRSINSKSQNFYQKNINEFDCESIEKYLLPNMNFLAAGWTKAVYKAEMRNDDIDSSYAIKTVDMTGQDVSQCLEKTKIDKKKDERVADTCYAKAARKIIKEIALLDQLQHPNVIKVFGYCIPKDFHSNPQKRRVMIVTELGEPVNLIKLLQLSWEDRLRIVLSLVKLLEFLSNSHLGSIIMNDMRRQQFVLVSGQLKLVDVDDIGLEEPRCTNDADCTTLITNLNKSQVSDFLAEENKVRCRNFTCTGFNEIKNVFNTARHFTTFLLPYGAPEQLRNRVDDLIKKFQHQVPTNILVEDVHQLKNIYASGSYLDENDYLMGKNESFRLINKADMIGRNDYSCKGSSSFSSCSISVANVQEAEILCQNQPICKAFVWTNDKSWTGRNIVCFKNDSLNWSSSDHNTTLYIKTA